jgi:Ca2+-binding RTX toxin-like protein
MPTVISANDSVYTNDVTLIDAPAVWITGDRIRFINSESGRVVTSSAGVPAIRMDGADDIVVNEAGGVIRSAIAGGTPLVIAGSAGADRVENAGTITGLVSLGGGSDTFISRVAANDSATVIDLGTGADFFYLRPSALFSLAPNVNGGDGEDRFVIFEVDGNVDGPLVSNFEILDLRTNGVVESFSDLEKILVDYRADGRTSSALRFFATPDADVLVVAESGNANLSIYDSSAINSLTGSAFSDRIVIGNDTLVSGAIDLGGGDDTLAVFRSQFEATQLASIGQAIDGGAGVDTLDIQLHGGDVFDAGNAVNFEAMFVSVTAASSSPLVLRHVDNLLDLSIFHRESVPVRIEDSDLSGARITLEPSVSVVIAGGTIVGSLASFVPVPIDTAVADDTKSISILNEGWVMGDVRMYIGDDVFDSRSGIILGQVYGYAGNDTILTGGGDNWLDGGAGADYLSAGEGSDTLLGGSGNDVLIGGSGNDLMNGGSGNDTYYVENAGDSVIEAAGQGNDRILTSVSVTLSAGQEIETLSAVDPAAMSALDLTGNAVGQTIGGNAGANVLIGGGGADYLVGFGGNDVLVGNADAASTLQGGTADDWYYVSRTGDSIVEFAGEGNDRVLTSVSFTLSASQSIETLSAADAAATTILDLTGNALAQVIGGNAAANILTGGGGADYIVGFGGDDILVGNADANSTLQGGTGNDWYYVSRTGDSLVEFAGEGNDRILTSVTYTLSAGQEIETLMAVDAAGTAAIDLAGNGFAQFIQGTNGANTLFGDGGADQLAGLGGSDVLLGGDGDDLLNGGTGGDVLNGGAGADMLVFSDALGLSNIDTVQDFVSGQDRLLVENAVFTGLAAGVLSSGAFANGTAAQDADDRIIYNQATGELWFDADGNGAGAAVQFALFGSGTTLTASDIVVI